MTRAWNEWGFLDYGALHPNLKSHHCDITQFEPSGRFDVIYQGSFFGGGISSPYRNGQPCRAAAADDPLEAINVRIVGRTTDPDKAPPAG